MQTLLLNEPGLLRIRNDSEPAPPKAGEALVKLRASGVCGTDLHAFRGTHPFFRYPCVPGHELAVEILEAGANDRNLRAGDLCAVDPYFECGHCRPCRAGKTNCCERLRLFGIHFDGGWRERFVYPLEKLHPGAGASPEDLALVEPLTVGAHAVNRARIESGESVLLIGAGPIGLAVLAALRPSAGTIAVMDLQPERLAFCRSWIGIRHILSPNTPNLEDAIRDVFDGALPSVVFDATGHAGSMERAFDLVAPAGRLIFVGLVPGKITFSDPDFHRKELTLLASRNGTAKEFRDIISKIETGVIDPASWITHRCRLEELPDEISGWASGNPAPIKAAVTV